MQDQTTVYEIKPREEIVKQLKAAYKLKDDTGEDLQRKRAEFLEGFEALGDWHAEQGKILSVNQGNSEVENPEIKEENKLIANRHLLKAVALYNMVMASVHYVPRQEDTETLQQISNYRPTLDNKAHKAVLVGREYITYQDQKYIRHAVNPDGDCGYTAMGITRETAYQLLLDNLVAIRDTIKPVIEEALLTEKFIHYLSEDHEGLKAAYHRYIDAQTQAAPNLPDMETALRRHADNLNIIREYINYDIRDKHIDAGWAHPFVLQAIANLRDISLQLWELSSEGIMRPHPLNVEEHRPDTEIPITHLLFINGNHFERLELDDSPELLSAPVGQDEVRSSAKPQETASITTDKDDNKKSIEQGENAPIDEQPQNQNTDENIRPETSTIKDTDISDRHSSLQHDIVTLDHQRLIQKIKSIEDQMVFFARAPADLPAPATEQTAEIYWQKNLDAKNKLQTIRDNAKKSLFDIDKQAGEQAIEPETYAAQVQQIYHDIAVGQQQLVRELLDDCLRQLPPPEGCIYSIIVLGSLAREEATPYSDFEWAILFQDQGEARNALHKTYFRRLAELLWIKILNLGETTSRMMDIEGINGKDEETYGSIPKGFSFDGQMADGCHTPLGNRHHKAIQEKYELIGTPHELAQFQQNTWEHKRGLSTVLSTVTVIHSNDAGLEHSLIKQYESEMEQIWNTPEEQTDQRTGKVTHQTLIQRRSLKFLAESSESFQFRGGRFDKEAHYFDAKYHLYRLPNMLIDHLASYFGITRQKNLWDRIEAIWGEQGVAPNKTGQENLKRTLSFILGLRSKAYLKKMFRDDHIIMFDPNKPEQNKKLLFKYLNVSEKNLVNVFFVLIQLQFTVENFVEQDDKSTVLQEAKYYYLSDFLQGYIYYLLLNYNKATGFWKKAIANYSCKSSRDFIFVGKVLNMLGNVYREQGIYEEAIKFYFEAQDIFIANHALQEYIAGVWNNLGLLYDVQGKNIEAMNAFKKSKDIRIDIYGEKHISVADSLNNLGMIYAKQGQYKTAIKCFKEAKRIKLDKHGMHHVSVADTLKNLGNVYSLQGKYRAAIRACERAKYIQIVTFGERHISVAGTLNTIGIIHILQGNYEKAINIYEEVKCIQIAIYDKQHISIADTLNNLSLAFVEQKLFEKADKLYQETINIYRKHGCAEQANVPSHFIREGNFFLLQRNMNFELARIYYEKFNVAVNARLDPGSPEVHKFLANQFYKLNQLMAIIEHYQILLRLVPDDVSVHHNLACMLHLRAQIEKDKGDEGQYKTYLDEATLHFETAIRLEANTGVCTEYSYFMWKNREYFSVETIVAMLQRAITLSQLEHRLSYSMMDRPTVIEQLQGLIDQENLVSFIALFLAHYLLVEVYCEMNQMELAIKTMNDAPRYEFKSIETIKMEEEQELQKGKFFTLILIKIFYIIHQAIQLIVRFIWRANQDKIAMQKNKNRMDAVDKEIRLANKLIELSQAAIEAKQKEISALSAQTNAEVEQQQQKEIKGMIDTQSQMSAQPFSGRSTSPAQLISQFSSVIRQPTAENPNVSQQAQASEQITDVDRVERVTADADIEYDDSRKLTQ